MIQNYIVVTVAYYRFTVKDETFDGSTYPNLKHRIYLCYYKRQTECQIRIQI